MGMFDFMKKREDVIDLGERYKKQQGKVQQTPQTKSAPDSGMGFLSGLANAGNSSNAPAMTEEDYPSIGDNIEQRRQKLAKRLMDMTKRIEDLSNQLFHLQQRLEVIERKMNINFE